MLQQEHSASAQKATAVATQLGVTPPTEPNKKQKAAEEIAKLGEPGEVATLAERRKEKGG